MGLRPPARERLALVGPGPPFRWLTRCGRIDGNDSGNKFRSGPGDVGRRPAGRPAEGGPPIGRLFFTIIITLVLALQRGDTVPRKDLFTYNLGALTSRYAFDFLGWETASLASKVKNHLVDADFAYLNEQRRQQTVSTYFATADLIDRLDGEITRIHAGSDAAQRARLPGLDGMLAAARQRLADLAPAAEAIIQGQVATILTEQGIGLSPLGIFPPVATRFESPPLILVISPREKIEIKTGAQLRPGLDLNQMEQLEADVDHLGVSSLVVAIGGISTYPAMIMESGNRDWTVTTVGHEWLHDYLFLRPLGWSYGQSSELIAINETVVDIAAEEVGDKTLERFYGVPIPNRVRSDEAPPAPGGDPQAFSFNREMRTTRLAADALLAQGKVDEAERYLEERRLFFVDKGYVIRKLNQAYFAFYGSYADGPVSVDPIGKDLRTLRGRTASLREFMDVTSRLTSYADLKALIR